MSFTDRNYKGQTIMKMYRDNVGWMTVKAPLDVMLLISDVLSNNVLTWLTWLNSRSHKGIAYLTTVIL